MYICVSTNTLKIQNSSIIGLPRAIHIRSYLPSHPIPNSWQLLSVSTLLSFQEGYINGIVQYVNFRDGLFSSQHSFLKIHPSSYLNQ